MTRSIIIDTDPGQDDAVAILLALASFEELEVLAITTVAGNVPLPLTTRNALMMCELAGRADVPVFAGAARPMVRDLITAEYVHGATGIDGADLPEPRTAPQRHHAVDYLVETLRAAEPKSVTVCTLGPLTNLGLALQRDAEIIDGIAEVVAMGGGFFEGGNTTPVAEFNILVDPHAADLVLRSGVPITLMPLDVTHQALTSERQMAKLRTVPDPVGTAVVGMLEFFERYDEERYGTDGGPLHDPCVIAYLLRPELFRGKNCNVEIELESELTVGMTVVDWWGQTDRPTNAMVMRSMDNDAFFDLLAARLARLPV